MKIKFRHKMHARRNEKTENRSMATSIAHVPVERRNIGSIHGCSVVLLGTAPCEIIRRDN